MKTIYENEGVRVQSASVCYLCGGEGEELYTHLRDRLFRAPGVWHLLHCSRCGLAWLSPRPASQEIGKLYISYYTHTASNRTLGGIDTLKKAVKSDVLATAFGYKEIILDGVNQILGRLLSRVGPLRDIVGSKVMWLKASQRGRLLDVGCGSGHFLSQMKDLGWDVVGVEPDAEAARIARERFGLNVYQGTLEEFEFPECTFDVVTMSHAIEHLCDPISSLRECLRVLKKGGRLVVVTPNIKSLGRRCFGIAWRAWDPPRHLFLFSPLTLRKCTELAGLQIQVVKTTAAEAHSIWYASRFLRRYGNLPDNLQQRVSWRLRLEGYLFWFLEHLLVRFRRSLGEGIVIVASKK